MTSNVCHHARRLAGPVGGAVVPVRPSWLLGVFLDALLAVSAYIASYWLRFDADQLAVFLPAAWSTLPLVVGLQILSLGALQAYAPRPRRHGRNVYRGRAIRQASRCWSFRGQAGASASGGALGP